jgi:hypothetical protein
LTKARIARISGGLVFIGLMLFSTLPAAAQDDFSLVLQINGAAKHTCTTLSNEVSPPSIFSPRDACDVVAQLMQPWIKEHTNQFTRSYVKDALNEYQTVQELFDLQDTGCAECEFSVQAFQAQLDEPDTIQSISEAMGAACVQNYRDPGVQQQCEDEVEQVVGGVVNSVVTNLPPHVDCYMLNYCAN